VSESAWLPDNFARVRQRERKRAIARELVAGLKSRASALARESSRLPVGLFVSAIFWSTDMQVDGSRDGGTGFYWPEVQGTRTGLAG